MYDVLDGEWWTSTDVTTVKHCKTRSPFPVTVANEGLGWDFPTKNGTILQGGDWNPGKGDNPSHNYKIISLTFSFQLIFSWDFR